MKSDRKAIGLNLRGYQRHIFLCTGASCGGDRGVELWDYLKEQLKARGLTHTPDAPVYRSKSSCLRICNDGPIAVVYPEAAWYRLLDRRAIDQIIEQHLVGGKIVEELCFAKNENFDTSGS